MSRIRSTRKLKATLRSRRLLVEQLEIRRVMAWNAAGPFSATNGQNENVANRPVSGAMRALLPDPTNAGILFAAATNGGIWKTTNATTSSTTWTPLTDTQSSQSFGAITFDNADPTFQTIWAGNAGYSSFGRISGALDGLLRSSDAGRLPLSR